MLSPLQQKRVWDGQLGAEIRSVYFGDLCNWYQRIQRLVTWLVFVCSSGAAVTFLANWLPPTMGWLRPLLAVISAASSLGLLVARPTQNAAECANLQFRYRKLASAFESLWDDMYSDDASATLDTLEATAADLEKSSLAFPEGKRRMKRWQDDVERHHESPVTA